MRGLLLQLALCSVAIWGFPVRSNAQQQEIPAAAASSETALDPKPLPDLRELVLSVEQNERTAEADRADYTYHLHIEQQELDSHGDLKKTVTTDSQSLTLKGVRVDRVLARDGTPLTPDEAKKEDQRLDKEVAKDLDRRAKRSEKGEPTDSRGDQIITAERILELGTFTNPRRVLLDGRPAIVADYAGDKTAKIRNTGEGIIRDLVGTAWFDEQDRVLVRGEGHFLNDFKIAGGLVLDIHKGFSFDYRRTKIHGEAWLPVAVDGQGSARYLLFGSINGSLHLAASDYRKYHTTSTIVATHGVIDDNGKPVDPTVGNDQPATSSK